MDLVVGVIDGGVQDECVETTSLAGADWSDPVMSLGPTEVSILVQGFAVPLRGFRFAAAVTDDCGGVRDGAIIAQIDVRDITELLDALVGISDPTLVCAALPIYGAECVACADSEVSCLDFVADSMDGAGGATFGPVTASDVAANPDCN